MCELLLVAVVVVILLFFFYHDGSNFQSNEEEIEAKIQCGTKQCGWDEYGNNCGMCQQGYKCLAHQCINDYLAVPYEDY
jgi:hypothetical protein